MFNKSGTGYANTQLFEYLYMFYEAVGCQLVLNAHVRHIGEQRCIKTSGFWAVSNSLDLGRVGIVRSK